MKKTKQLQNSHFLLGGKDLEMLTIKEILIKHNLNFLDKNLSWGAKLSAYQNVLNDTDTFIGIELIEDIPLPKHYVQIDHHNEKEHLPASIEQLAELLDIELTRQQQLIAQNDKGYIPAMQAFGATQLEIDEIRLLDRQAQGVTEMHETEAKRAIQHDLITNGKAAIIKTTSDKFSPITDRLFGTNHLIVYNDKTLNYYGSAKSKIVTFYQEMIYTNKAYHGGGDNGFFGLAAGHWSADEIEHVISGILKIINDEE